MLNLSANGINGINGLNGINATTAATTAGAGAVQALLGAAVAWATGRNPVNVSSRTDRADPADTRPLLRIDANIAALLDIDVTPQRARRGVATAAPAFASTHAGTDPGAAATQDVARLLQPSLTVARLWLASPMTRAELAAQGLTAAFVGRYLQRNADRFVQGHPARSWDLMTETQVKFPQIPTAHDLISYSLLDAQVAHALRPLQAPTTSTISATVSPVPVEGYFVESTRGKVRNRAQAMEVLRQFRGNIRTHLPQIGAPTIAGFWGLEQGQVALNNLQVALSVVPCGAQVHCPKDSRCTVTYPQGQGSSAQLQRITVNGEEVLIARGENRNRVVYSFDGIVWYNSFVYTDDGVEAEKLAIWTGIVDASKRAAAQHVRSARWMTWRA